MSIAIRPPGRTMPETQPVLDLALAGFTAFMMAMGMRRPFLWVLAYLYIDILMPQKFSYFLLASIPISLITFVAAFGGWLATDEKTDCRFTLRQFLILLLLIYCGATTLSADFPEQALDKWAWVWKALLFAMFLPLTLRTRLRFEAVALVMVLTAGAIIISGSIKTLATGGGYGSLHLFVADSFGLYESSIISCVAVAIIPLILWLSKHGTVFPRDWRVRLFSAALIFACLLIPIGTQARTGLLCIGLLALLLLRTTRRRFLYLGLAGALVVIAVPFLPDSYTKRMNTIENHEGDQSAATRIAIWQWTIDYAGDHPFGGGFMSYLGNKVHVDLRTAEQDGSQTRIESDRVQDKARAFHSSYFEMLGEQGYPGLALWLLLMISGLWQMERIYRRWRKRTGEGEMWQAPLAMALQQAQLIYMLGSVFVGIAFQPFCFMLIGMQCGLWSYLKRIEKPLPARRTMQAAPKQVPSTVRA